MEYKFKVIVLGNFSSGKTSIVKRVKDESFYEAYTSTIGVDFIRKRYEHQDLFNEVMTLEDGEATYEISKKARLDNFKPNEPIFKKYHKIVDTIRRDDISYYISIWDTSGQEKFSKITTAYFRNITACILVFDITNYTSFTSVKLWYRDLLNRVNDSDRCNFPMVLVGNKSDLAHERMVSLTECNRLADALGCSYIECSAKTNHNVTSIFSELVKNIVFKINHELIVPSHKNGINIVHNEIELFPKEVFDIDNTNEQKCCIIM
jgi:small GTP-binding protein